MKKIIFLDIDGPVIPLKNISAVWRRESQQSRYKVFGLAAEFLNNAEQERDPLQCSDPYAVLMITQLAELADAKIVISSSWRNLSRDKESFIPKFQHLGFDPALLHDDWCTPTFGGSHPVREQEILDWVSRHPEVTHYITIDDEPLDLPTHIQVCAENGFLHSNFNQSLGHLGCDEEKINLDSYWVATVGFHGPAHLLDDQRLQSVYTRLEQLRRNDERDYEF
jgi:hypothetical protein